MNKMTVCETGIVLTFYHENPLEVGVPSKKHVTKR